MADMTVRTQDKEAKGTETCTEKRNKTQSDTKMHKNATLFSTRPTFVLSSGRHEI